jgi:hypothetical protein
VVAENLIIFNSVPGTDLVKTFVLRELSLVGLSAAFVVPSKNVSSVQILTLSLVLILVIVNL